MNKLGGRTAPRVARGGGGGGRGGGTNGPPPKRSRGGSQDSDNDEDNTPEFLAEDDEEAMMALAEEHEMMEEGMMVDDDGGQSKWDREARDALKPAQEDLVFQQVEIDHYIGMSCHMSLRNGALDKNYDTQSILH